MPHIYTPFQPTLTQTGLQRLGLKLESKIPCSALSNVVLSYLQISVDTQTLYPVMPDGTQAIYFSPLGWMIGGALTEARDLHLLQPGKYFGIWFYPAALRHFFPANLAEITDQFVADDYFQHHSVKQLQHEIYGSKTFSERADICEKWLLKRFFLKPVAQFDYALSLIYQSHGGTKIEQIAHKIGWSSRHLNRQFLLHTGLNTKTFTQVIRAQYAYKQLNQNSKQAQSASLDLGYYDQPHLIKAFKKYFHSTPRQLNK